MRMDARGFAPTVNAFAPALVLAWTAALVAVSVFAHPTPLYFVETDLLGEYIPAAREWIAGHVDLGHYAYKGPGYPLLLALFGGMTRADLWLVARVLSPLGAGIAAWFAFRLARALVGEAVGAFVLLAMLAAPVMMRYAIEAGTDAPALALMLASTWLVLGARGGRARFFAGLLAGLATLTRTNAAFLLPCAVIVLAFSPPRARTLAAYALGAALPLAAWAWFAARHGGLPADRNYLNVAWELYGQGVPWDRFEATTGARFHSMLDVLRFDPLRAAAHVARNVVTQRVDDLRDLTTPWLGALALPGLFVLAGTRRARGWLLHGAACALVLAPVFYNARFGLYLLPLELAATGATLAWIAARVTVRRAVGALAAVLLAGALATGIAETAEHLRDAPHETRLAGRALAHMGLGEKLILARKPHVAYFAGMRTEALPLDVRLADLPGWARANSAEYLFYSGLELSQRPEWGVLADSAVTLPGFEPIAWDRLPRGHFYAVYRLHDAGADSATFARAYAAALDRCEALHPDSPSALLFVAVQRLGLGDAKAALRDLDRLKQGGARDVSVEQYRCLALLALGDLDGAAAACEAALQLAPPTAWRWAKLGEIRGRQGKKDAARDAYAHAVALASTNLDYVESLGRAQIDTGHFAEAAQTFEQAVRLAPRDATARRYAMGAWQLAGNTPRMEALYREGLAAGITAEEMTGRAGSAPAPAPAR